MVRFLIALMALFSLNASAIYSPNIPTIVACGTSIQIPAGIQPASVIYLGCYIGTTAHYCTFRSVNASAGYQVPTGKTLHVFAACQPPGSASSVSNFGLLYGTSDVGIDSASAPTGQVNAYGYISNYLQIGTVWGNGPISGLSQTDFQVPQNDYLGMQGSAAQVAFAFGYLQ